MKINNSKKEKKGQLPTSIQDLSQMLLWLLLLMI